MLGVLDPAAVAGMVLAVRVVAAIGRGLFERCCWSAGIVDAKLPLRRERSSKDTRTPLPGLDPRHVVDNHAEERLQRVGAATSARPEEI